MLRRGEGEGGFWEVWTGAPGGSDVVLGYWYVAGALVEDDQWHPEMFASATRPARRLCLGYLAGGMNMPTKMSRDKDVGMPPVVLLRPGGLDAQLRVSAAISRLAGFAVVDPLAEGIGGDAEDFFGGGGAAEPGDGEASPEVFPDGHGDGWGVGGCGRIRRLARRGVGLPRRVFR